MAGFRPAKAAQAAIKMSLFGPQGSGKTFSALLFAEGLAQRAGKRTAVIDTERGTDFYTKQVSERLVHPEAFLFDALYTRSLTESLAECRRLPVADYGQVIIDSLTHLWEAARLAYQGPLQRNGSIPISAWNTLKKPYKELVDFLISSPFHVFLVGRQTESFGSDSESGDTVSLGPKMQVEKSTPYEPHICLRFESVRKLDKRRGKPLLAVPTAFAEKDRSGVLQGRAIEWPNFDNVIAPVLRLLEGEQAVLPSEDDAALQDSEALRKQDAERRASSQLLRRQFLARFLKASSLAEADAVAASISPAVKKQLLSEDLAAVRAGYLEAKGKVLDLPTPAAEVEQTEED